MKCGHKFGSHLTPRPSGHPDFISWVVTLWERESRLLSVPPQTPVPALKLQLFNPEAKPGQPSCHSHHQHQQPSWLPPVTRGASPFPSPGSGPPCRCEHQTLTPGLLPPPPPPLLPEEEPALFPYKGKQEPARVLKGPKGPNNSQPPTPAPTSTPPVLSQSVTEGSYSEHREGQAWPRVSGKVGQLGDSELLLPTSQHVLGVARPLQPNCTEAP